MKHNSNCYVIKLFMSTNKYLQIPLVLNSEGSFQHQVEVVSEKHQRLGTA